MVQESVDVRNANSAIRQSAAALPSTLQGSRIPPACSSSASAPIRRFRRYQLRAANSCTPAEGSHYNLRLDHQFSTAFRIYGSYTQNNQSGFNRPINIKAENAEFDASQGVLTPFKQLNSSVGYTW